MSACQGKREERQTWKRCERRAQCDIWITQTEPPHMNGPDVCTGKRLDQHRSNLNACQEDHLFPTAVGEYNVKTRSHDELDSLAWISHGDRRDKPRWPQKEKSGNGRHKRLAANTDSRPDVPTVAHCLLHSTVFAHTLLPHPIPETRPCDRKQIQA